MSNSIDARQNRKVIRQSEGVPASDGAGVKLTRIIGRPGFEQVDPFLLLDIFRSDQAADYIAGFPPHPHRGFETVTYMFAGRMRHEDNAGHAGIIESGGVQWMTAGRGIIHSEMPEQESGLMWGCQLWVNLPASQKMVAPNYQEYDAGSIPLEHRDQTVRLKVIAGKTSHGTQGIVQNVAVEPLYFDISIKAGDLFIEPIAQTHNAFIVVIEGAVNVLADGDSESMSQVNAGSIGILGDGGQVSISGNAPDSRLLLIAGRKLNEPIARSGPFVMNTREEVMQAFDDYHAGRF